MKRALRSEADIYAAGAAAVRAWREGGWRLGEQQVDHVVAVLAPAREVLQDQPERRVAA